MPWPDYTVPDLGTWPLLRGPFDAVEGYYELERQERAIALDAVTAHVADAALWYRLLSLHRRAFLGGFDFTGAVEGLECQSRRRILRALGLRMELLGLSLSYSKAALDMLLIGSYGVAFAAIRHVIETFLFCRWVGANPDNAAPFYVPLSGEKVSVVPRVPTVKEKLKKWSPHDALAYEVMYRSWKMMSSGGHPSAFGIGQVRDEPTKSRVVGATYHPEMGGDGFDHGPPAALAVVMEIEALQPQSRAWSGELQTLATTIGARVRHIDAASPPP